MTMGRIKMSSISARLMMYFVCIIVIPIVILALIIQNTYKKSIFGLATSNAEEGLNLINDNLDQQFIDYDSLAYFVTRDLQIQEVSKESQQQYNQRAEKQQIYNLLNYYRSSVSDIIRIVVYYENGTVITTKQEDALQGMKQNMSWYDICKADADSIHIFNFKANERIYDVIKPQNTQIISASRALKDQQGNIIGAVSIEMHSQILKESISNILNRKGSYVYVLNENGDVVYSPVLETVPQVVSDDDYCKVQVYNERNRWTIIGMVSMKPYLRELDAFNNILLVVLIVSIIIIGIVSLRFGESIVKPIKMLRKLMKEAEQGDLSVRFVAKASEEIQDLGESFNVMIEQMDYNVQQVCIEQEAKSKAEMDALRANIKPHFLYNTLDTIHWMAKSYHAEDIIETVDALSTLFRILLSKGSETITVEQELLHIESYLKIQKVRYEDMINYEICVSANCQKLLVQKIVLQPLVENAIYHGIKEGGESGEISINVWRDVDDIYFAVEDNGKGMTKERLEQVQETLKKFTPSESGAYGVVNVHHRMRLSYGAPYGLYLNSEKDIGTTAVIQHPVL